MATKKQDEAVRNYLLALRDPDSLKDEDRIAELRKAIEQTDDELERLAREYRSGNLLSGELKQIAIERITDFLVEHQRRRAALGSLADELEPFRLTAEERQAALESAGVPTSLRA